jgi:hypothetical protein
MAITGSFVVARVRVSVICANEVLMSAPRLGAGPLLP